MKIIVCIKQIPDTDEVRVDPRTHTLIREGVPYITNPPDLCALEEALRLRERLGGRVVAISMGPPQASEALKEAISLGADEAVLLSDRRFAGADTLATSYVLARCIERLAPYDLVICGNRSRDAETGHVGPQVAHFLSIPHVTDVRQVELLSPRSLRLHKAVEGGLDVIEAEFPLLITVAEGINQPRMPSLKGMMRTKNLELPIWSADDIDTPLEMIGLRGSPTQVIEVESVQDTGGSCEFIGGSPAEAVRVLVRLLVDRKVI